MRSAIAMLAVSLASCVVDIGPFPAGFACADGLCPDGQSCVGGFCVSGADAAPIEDDADVPKRVCGGASALAEDFMESSDWWVDGFPEASVTSNGALELIVAAGATADATFAFSGPRLDLVDSSFFLRVTPAAGALTLLGLQPGSFGDSSELVAIELRAGELRFGRLSDPAPFSIAYDSNVDVFWGYRETGGVLHYETSADGIAFVSHYQEPAPPYVDRFQVVFGNTRQAGGEELRLRLDDVNGAVTSDVFCAASDFSDDFEDGVLDEKWSQFATGCGGVSEAGGELIVVTPANDSCVFATTNLHDLRNSEFELELGSVIPSGFFGYRISGEYGALNIDHNGGNITVSDCPEDVCTVINTVARLDRNIWRFRGDETTIYAEISANGVDYATIGSTMAIDPRATKAAIISGSGHEIRFARFN